MAGPWLPRSSILWRNKEQTVTLIDIPQSIKVAQQTDECPFDDVLTSTDALRFPYESNEPKSEAAKAKVEANSVQQKIHSSYEPLINSALAEIRRDHQGAWCGPRVFPVGFPVGGPGAGDKRKWNDTDDETLDDSQHEEPHELPHPLHDLVYPSNPSFFMCNLEPCRKHEHDESNDDLESVDITFVRNDSTHRKILCVFTIQGLEQIDFAIPPKSTFSLSDCSETRPYHKAGEKYDMIILDPPWPNRSVKRARKTSRSTYKTESGTSGIRSLLKKLCLKELMSDECMVGIWITNKAAIRELLLGQNGLFTKFWDLELVEEWIWLKTTLNGEPVSELGALWRKPYEIFLLGRRRAKPPSEEPVASTGDETKVEQPEANERSNHAHVKQRVLVGVPDFHSRKPCLKELLSESVAPNGRVLEIFARHLVAGWSSWGDECIKFNWQGYHWGDKPPDDEPEGDWLDEVEQTDESREDE